MSSRVGVALLAISLSISLAVTGAFLGRDQLLLRTATALSGRLEAKLGLPIIVGGAQLMGTDQMRFEGIRLGGPPLLTIRSIEIQLRAGTLLAGAPKVDLIRVDTPTLYLDLSGGPRAAAEPLLTLYRRLRSQDRVAKASDASRSKGQQWRQKIRELFDEESEVELLRGQLLENQQRLWISEGHLKGKLRAASGSWEAHQPKAGRCTFQGTSETLQISCDRDFHYPVGDSISVSGRRLELSWRPTPTLLLGDLKLSLGRLGAKFSEGDSPLQLDLAVGLSEGADGTRPIELSLLFPGGGRITAVGKSSREKCELSLQLSAFPLRQIQRSFRGAFSASGRLEADWRDGHLELQGEASASGLRVFHEALSTQPVGPSDLKLKSALSVNWNPSNPKRFLLRFKRSTLQVGALHVSGEASFDQRGEAPKVNADLILDRIRGDRLAASIPPGLLPNLQPIELDGSFGWRGRLALDMSRLDDTVLKVRANTRRLKVISHNPELDFDALRHRFTTSFEMPDGTIFERESGPESERWVPRDQIPPLLPLAIMTQEDGGFYRHGGISVFHLRGSLIRNLKEGRFVRGGSTLTMQLARNLFLHKKKTLSRKLEEICLSWLLERRFSKDELLDFYMNIVEFGRDRFGIKEAARDYFAKEVSALRPEEIAALVRMLPGPRLYERFFQRERLSRAYTQRVNRLLQLLERRGHLPAESYQLITPTSLWEVSPELESPR